MKKILVLMGMVMASIALMSSCSSKPNSDTHPVAQDTEMSTIDADVTKNYSKADIEKAQIREEIIKDFDKPNNASTFGKKICQSQKRLFTFTLSGIKEVGVATLIVYQKGIEIDKDGKSWFYDFANSTERFQQVDYPELNYTAVQSILHKDVWEPAYISSDLGTGTPSFYLRPIYGNFAKDEAQQEIFIFWNYAQGELNVTNTADFTISKSIQKF